MVITMALFESYERRIDKINSVLSQYGISSVEECRDICKAAGFDPAIKPGNGWDLWKRIAALDDSFGHPEKFCSQPELTNWESATITTLDEKIPRYIQKICKRDPFSGHTVTGGIPFLRKAAGTLQKLQVVVILPCDDRVLMYAVQRPNQLHTVEVFAAELRRHGLQLSAVKKAHDRCFHNVGKMVPQCDLVAAKFQSFLV